MTNVDIIKKNLRKIKRDRDREIASLKREFHRKRKTIVHRCNQAIAAAMQEIEQVQEAC